MFLNEKQKGLKSKALEELLTVIDSADAGRFKKPMAAEVSVTEIEPKDGEMEDIGEIETENEGESMSGPSSEEKMMITELYNKYCK